MSSTANTTRAKYSFRVKEFGNGTPWVYLELYAEPDLPAIAPGFLGFDLKPGTTHEQAKEIAAYLRAHIVSVSHTKFTN